MIHCCQHLVGVINLPLESNRIIYLNCWTLTFVQEPRSSWHRKYILLRSRINRIRLQKEHHRYTPVHILHTVLSFPHLRGAGADVKGILTTSIYSSKGGSYFLCQFPIICWEDISIFILNTLVWFCSNMIQYSIHIPRIHIIANIYTNPIFFIKRRK